MMKQVGYRVDARYEYMCMAYRYLSYDVTVIQWITYVINNVMTTRWFKHISIVGFVHRTTYKDI